MATTDWFFHPCYLKATYSVGTQCSYLHTLVVGRKQKNWRSIINIMLLLCVVLDQLALVSTIHLSALYLVSVGCLLGCCVSG